MSERRILVIGASGDQGRSVVRILAEREPAFALTLAGRRESTLRELATGLPVDASVASLDVLDAGGLRAAAADADLVVNAAGPYHVTAAPVMRACVEAGTSYLDFQDDPEGVVVARELAGEAERQGISLLICCGAAPGLYNLAARDLVDGLDRAVAVDFGWVVGDEGARRPGAATLQHLLHITARSCVRFEDGSERQVEPMATTSAFPIHGLGSYELYEMGHAEPLTFPAGREELQRVRCFGGFHPRPLNGLMAGIARAVVRDELALDDAVKFVQDVADDGVGSLRGWRHALPGAKRLHSLRDIGVMLGRGAIRSHADFTGGLAVRVVGERDGGPVTVLRRTSAWGPDTFWRTFDELNGRAVAAFTALALEALPGPGLHFPEQWVATDALLDTMARHGAPREEILDPEEIAETPPREASSLLSAAGV